MIKNVGQDQERICVECRRPIEPYYSACYCNLSTPEGRYSEEDAELASRFDNIDVKKRLDDLLETLLNTVNHPAHYNDGKIEVIEFIEDKALGFHLGNAIKYIARAGKKDPAKLTEDLEKAIWYVKRFIEIQKEIG